MTFRLRNPLTGGEFNVSTVRRRDRFLRRGFLPAEEPITVTKTHEKSYRDVQAEAKALGISANQTREELEKAIADHEE
jgi:hypothetical protein